jgi:hypothetical protein
VDIWSICIPSWALPVMTLWRISAVAAKRNTPSAPLSEIMVSMISALVSLNSSMPRNRYW